MTNYDSLGIKRVINATGTVTMLGGSIMPPEVVAAWVEASKSFVNIVELQQKVSARIAELLHVESALVTTGASGAIVLGTAATLTHDDASRIHRLPFDPGPRNEIILQKSHYSEYDSQLTGTGGRLIPVETIENLRQAISAKTAMMFFMNDADRDGQIHHAEWTSIARQNQIPTLIDASADVPPIERINEYIAAGFDMIALSGGKAIRGPNDTGLLLGKPQFIEAARRNASPFAPTFGRMMKVGKEDMMALLAAIERFVSLDHKAVWAENERRIAVIEASLRDIHALRTERVVPPIANHQPHLVIDWNETEFGLSKQQVREQLLNGTPSIQIGRVAGTGDNGILISVLALEAGEETIIASRLREIFHR